LLDFVVAEVPGAILRDSVEANGIFTLWLPVTTDRCLQRVSQTATGTSAATIDYWKDEAQSDQKIMFSPLAYTGTSTASASKSTTFLAGVHLNSACK
jgi:hypothetical protein